MKNKFFTSLLAATLTMSALPATAIYANETNASNDTLIPINETTFEDDNFRAMALEDLDADQDGYFSSEEIVAVSDLDFMWMGEGNEITSLKGIEYFTELESLGVSGNKLTTLDLSKNTKLKYVDADYNQLTSINVTGCKDITSLYVESNKLTALDTTTLTNLEALTCSDNQIKALDLSKNTKLDTLYAENNQLETLDVSKNPTLRIVSLANNNLKTLDLSNLKELAIIDASHNYITSLDTSNNPDVQVVRYLAKEIDLGTTEPVPFDKIGGFMEHIQDFEGADLDRMFEREGLIIDFTKDTIQLEKGKTEGILRINMGDDIYEEFKFFYTPAPKPQPKPEVKPETKPEVKPESKPAQKVENTENPKTGDTTNYMFLVSSFVVAGAAALKLRKKVMD